MRAETSGRSDIKSDTRHTRGLDHTTSHQADAYNLSVNNINTYHVDIDGQSVLVHNTNRRDCNDGGDYDGGRFGDLDTGDGIERHHMPADAASDVARNDGPAIQMEASDHQQTASWGNSLEAQSYRQQQAELISAGRRDDAIQMDIDDVTTLFPGIYDAAILSMIERLD